MKSTRFKQRSEFFLIADITVKVWLLVFVVANIQLHMSGIYTGTCPSLDGPSTEVWSAAGWRRLCEPSKSFIQKHSTNPYSPPGLCLPNVSQNRPRFSWGCTLRRKTDRLTHLNKCNWARPYGTSPVQTCTPNTCFSSSLKYLDNNIWITFPELFYRCSVQFSSITQSYPVLWDPMDCSMPGFPVHQLLELAQTF